MHPQAFGIPIGISSDSFLSSRARDPCCARATRSAKVLFLKLGFSRTIALPKIQVVSERCPCFARETIVTLKQTLRARPTLVASLIRESSFFQAAVPTTQPNIIALTFLI